VDLLEDHPDRPLPDLLRIPGSPCHDPILSRNGVSGKPGGLQVPGFPEIPVSARAPVLRKVLQDVAALVDRAAVNDRQRWKTRVELANTMLEYLETFHNRRRRHSSMGMVSPAEHGIRNAS
jgi:transposase InsO family protein